MPGFRERLEQKTPLIFDGPTGTELQRRGLVLEPPLWSARAMVEASELLGVIHRDYVEAGAEVITANTFRTHARNLESAGWSARARELTLRAVDVAREAAGSRAWVAGSMAPVGDCYAPDQTPEDDVLDESHRQLAEHLREAGVDLILVETQVTIREGIIAARAGVATGLPTLVSFVCRRDGCLFSGEHPAEAARGVLPLGIHGLLVNCLPAESVADCLEEYRSVCGELPLGAYANAGWLREDGVWEPSTADDPVQYRDLAARWLAAGVRFVGGCCGTRVEHIVQLRQLVGEPGN